MNSFIKHIIESFDFSSTNKKKKSINVYEVLLPGILEKIDDRKDLTSEEYDILTSFTGVYHVNDKEELSNLIQYFVDTYGNDCNLNWINVSNITDMSLLFDEIEFDGDISEWDVSNVTNMSCMFYKANFWGGISKWNVSNVTNMYAMFYESEFRGDISNWDVSNVTNM